MAAIVDNFDGRALQLGNEEFVRTMQWGNNWNYLRFGVRLVFNGTSNILTPRFQLGLCSGDQDTFSSPNCVQYIGTNQNYFTATMTYSGGGGYYSGNLFTNTNTYCTTKVGSTTTDFGSTGGLNQYARAASSSLTSVYFSDFVRLSSTSVSARHTQTAVAEIADVSSFYTFMRFMENEGGSGGTQVTQFSTVRNLTGLSSTILDTASIYWNKSTPTVEISEMCLVRFY